MAMGLERRVALRAGIFVLLLIVLGWTFVGTYRQWVAAKALQKQAEQLADDARRELPRNVTFDDARTYLAGHGYEVVRWKHNDGHPWVGQQEYNGSTIAVVAGQKPLTAADSPSGPVWVYLAFQFDPKGSFRQLGAWPTFKPVQSEPETRQ